MKEEKPKLPPPDGAKKALEYIKQFRKIEPSERLIKIISEYGQEEDRLEEERKKKSKVAKESEL